MNEQSEYEKTKKQFYENYKTSGMISISPLLLSYNLINTKPSQSGGYDFSGTFKMLGYISIPATIILTPVTLLAGAVGALGNTAWGLVTLLPLATAANDTEVQKEPVVEKVVSSASTQTILQQAPPSPERTVHQEPFISVGLLKRSPEKTAEVSAVTPTLRG
jgi:hypothetical protein